MKSLVLYNYWRSSSSQRVRIALHYKNIPFEYRAVHLAQGEQHQAAHRARNPSGMVPVLEWTEGGQTRRLNESLAIIVWLDAVFPDNPLLPADPYRRAQAWALAEGINSGIQPYQNLQVLQHLKNQLHADEKAWAAHWIAHGLKATEAAAQSTAGHFSVGDAVSIADACLIPQLHAARRFGVDLKAFPSLSRVEQNCVALPAFQKAAPEAQPDATL